MKYLYCSDYELFSTFFTQLHTQDDIFIYKQLTNHTDNTLYIQMISKKIVVTKCSFFEQLAAYMNNMLVEDAFFKEQIETNVFFYFLNTKDTQ